MVSPYLGIKTHGFNPRIQPDQPGHPKRLGSPIPAQIIHGRGQILDGKSTEKHEQNMNNLAGWLVSEFF